MKRVSVCIAALAAVVAAGCSGSEGGATPTAPSASTSSGGTAPPPPQASCTMPAAPTNLKVDYVQGSTVSFSWSGVSGATQYLVLIGSTPGNSEDVFTNTSQTTYATGGIKQGHHYARVQSKNSCGTSGSSNEVDFSVAG